MTPIEIVVAVDVDLGIGKDGRLPWRLPGDMAHFRRLTIRTRADNGRNAVIMGRRTWDSIPLRFRPLARRLNVVVTRNERLEVDPGVLLANSLPAAFERATNDPTTERVFLIGGGTLYRAALPLRACRVVHLTRIDAHFDCDTFFPELEPTWELEWTSGSHEDAGISYRFERWVRTVA